MRRSTMRDIGGYNTDVLFENLELERAIRAAGGIVSDRPDICVSRRPASFAHFRLQRVRQAYDSFAQPRRFLIEAAIIPTVWILRGHPCGLAALTLTSIVVAEYGKARAGGRNVFPASSAVWAPLWLLERGTAIWAAVGPRLRGGVRYGRRRMHVAAHSTTWITRKLANRSPGET